VLSGIGRGHSSAGRQACAAFSPTRPENLPAAPRGVSRTETMRASALQSTWLECLFHSALPKPDRASSSARVGVALRPKKDRRGYLCRLTIATPSRRVRRSDGCG
jgi:hypothetical protein